MLLPPKAHSENNVLFKSCSWRKTANYSSRGKKKMKLLNNLIIQPLYKKRSKPKQGMQLNAILNLLFDRSIFYLCSPGTEVLY